jgi:hypothetical protein
LEEIASLRADLQAMEARSQAQKEVHIASLVSKESEISTMQETIAGLHKASVKEQESTRAHLEAAAKQQGLLDETKSELLELTTEQRLEQKQLDEALREAQKELADRKSQVRGTGRGRELERATPATRAWAAHQDTELTGSGVQVTALQARMTESAAKVEELQAAGSGLSQELRSAEINVTEHKAKAESLWAEKEQVRATRTVDTPEAL